MPRSDEGTVAARINSKKDHVVCGHQACGHRLAGITRVCTEARPDAAVADETTWRGVLMDLAESGFSGEVAIELVGGRGKMYLLPDGACGLKIYLLPGWKQREDGVFTLTRYASKRVAKGDIARYRRGAEERQGEANARHGQPNRCLDPAEQVLQFYCPSCSRLNVLDLKAIGITHVHNDGWNDEAHSAVKGAPINTGG